MIETEKKKWRSIKKTAAVEYEENDFEEDNNKEEEMVINALRVNEDEKEKDEKLVKLQNLKKKKKKKELKKRFAHPQKKIKDQNDKSLLFF